MNLFSKKPFPFGDLPLLTMFSALFLSSYLVAEPFAAPDQAGPYRVGFTTFTSEVGGTIGNSLPTKITVWYPHCLASDVGCFSNPANTAGTYVATIFSGPNPSFSMPSPLGAVENSSVQAGSFPFIVWAHPGGPYPTDREAFRLANNPLMEVLASHGFIVASYERNSNGICGNDLSGPRDVITTMQARNTTTNDMFEGRIDSNKIGAMGHSGGGNPIVSLVTGADPNPGLPLGIGPDLRVKAIQVAEGASSTACGVTDARRAASTMPVMLLGGSPDSFNSNTLIPFGKFINATPRLLVKNMTKSNNPTNALNAEHFTYSSATCDIVNQSRERSLQLQQTSGQTPFVEPLSSTFPSDSTILDSGARVIATETRFFWNGPVAIARAKTFCDHVGVNSAFSDGTINIDADQDGLTDVPPFVTGPLAFPTFTVCTVPALVGSRSEGCITADRMNRMLNLFTVSFWKTFLSGDTRYAQFLTQDYSNSEPEAITTTVDPNADVSPVSLSETRILGESSTSQKSLAVSNPTQANQLSAPLHWSLNETASGCDSLGDVNWLTISSGSGTTATDATNTVDVFFNPIGQSVGLKSAKLCLLSDDLDHPVIEVPISLHVVYNFRGFFQPIENLDSATPMNLAKVGQSIPIKFSLTGFQGLDILAGTPTVRPISCAREDVDPTPIPIDSVAAGLSYDASTDSYIYVWKTKGLAAGCYELDLGLRDGTHHGADFQLKK